MHPRLTAEGVPAITWTMLRWPARILRWLLVPRLTVPFAASVAYVGLTALRATALVDRFAWLAATVGFLVAADRIRREKRRVGLLEPLRGDETLIVWTVAIGISTLGAAPKTSPANDLFAAIAMGTAALLAARPLLELEEPSGMLSGPAAASRYLLFVPRFTQLFLAIGWAFVVFSELEAVLRRSEALADSAADLAGIVIVCSALLLFVTGVYLSKERILALETATRASSYAGRIALASAAVLAIRLASSVTFAELGRVALPALAWLGVRAVRHPHPVRDAQRVRRGLALTVIGAPVLLLGVTASHGRDASLVTALTGAALLAVGALGRYLEDPLRPAQGVLLDAIGHAEAALAGAEPETAARDVLVKLREPLSPESHSPRLYTLDPPRVLEVDAAGYLHPHPAVLHPDLVATAKLEPHATVRTDALDALAVRRADLRSLGAYMDREDMLLATLVIKDGEVEGVLVVPTETARQPITLEEVVALKRLADGVAGALAEESRVARAREREVALRRDVEQLGAELTAAREETEMRSEANRLATTRLARPATIGIYSDTAAEVGRVLEARAQKSQATCVVGPSGIDAVPYGARAHLSGPRAAQPFVVIEGTSSREHDPERWREPLTSPLALAEGGVLFLVDGASLPRDVQRLLADAFAERRAPWTHPLPAIAVGPGSASKARSAAPLTLQPPLDVVPWLATTRTPRQLVDEGELDPALAARFGDSLDAPVLLPRLRQRPEDLRSIVADRLAREGLRVRGRPIGIDDAAYALLVEHDFPGDDLELSALVERLVATAAADVVHAADVRTHLAEATAASGAAASTVLSRRNGA
jgi:hypothetical protein